MRSVTIKALSLDPDLAEVNTALRHLLARVSKRAQILISNGNSASWVRTWITGHGYNWYADALSDQFYQAVESTVGV